MRVIGHWTGGKPVEGASGRSGPVFDPASGEQTAEVAFASPDEVDAAVRAASEAFEQWSGSSLSTRAKTLFAFRELVNAHVEELAGVVSDEHGKVITDARGEVQRGLEVVEFACGIPQLLEGRVLGPGLDRRRHVLVPPAARGGVRDHAVQFPGHGADVDAPDRHRLRQHFRLETERT